LNRFRVAFAALLFVATATSLLAGWGVVGSSPPSSGAASTTYTTSLTSTATTVSASTTVGTATVTSTTTVTGSATTVTTTTQSQATFGSSSGSSIFYTLSTSLQGEALLREVQTASLLLAPVCWIVLGGMWVWRGRVRARYSEMGFGSDVFELFMKMKGGATRIKVLNTLTTPKDRLQLAEELGVDWKTVDRHVQILNKYGFVKEQAAYGTVKLYEVTPMGRMLLNLFDDLERTDGPAAQAQSPTRPQAERPSA